ncbi:glutamine--tRNA ligase [Enterobacter hormaechei]|jgi:glutaminyl-tRNA synthetase|uniref:glutamine--tRNA ligase n=1 Tax=Gammaproteobacteria TaxID=1236 RepID=UPI0008248220|nr:glutamine--tRNA ligase [Stenotrophomonas maltophilia]ELE9794206.1 glutamine--tRNA ligase [Pseudomonas aeruginosa]MBK4306161.1 glutamine--tRNA ligase [Enterobacter hormaechei]MCA0324823.1 glutamine--tRNA ligase [Pseudomonadota bacterium]HRE85505.1 glutamine--tRNA ligase [Accumulibacter sp.]HRL66708.1 glutamine--tRNA ligase [Ottowia sp.]
MTSLVDKDSTKPSNFLRHVIENDLKHGVYAARKWGGSPGDSLHHAQGMQDPAKVRTRFPPEPNGYLHIGHAKSIWLNFELAKEYGGVCHLRFDDTNPEKEEQEYVDGIRDAVKWLGYETYLADRPDAPGIAQPHEYFASDYFDFMYRAAEYLITAGLAYVDEQTPDQMRATRGDFNTPGIDSPFRARSPAENLAYFRQMRDGEIEDGAATLRAKIDMANPNINMRDPALYRIRRATHHNTGDMWCIYPMYTYAHPIEDALEQITHSIATLEFEDQRPFYDWLLYRLAEGGLIASPHPRQYEFARLNVTHVITSKRKLRQLVEDGHVDGWDDPRMPTIAGLRRRGYTPEALKLFCERSGVTKSGGWIDYASLEAALRDTLDPIATRAMAVLDPVKLVITNWAELMGSDALLDDCTAPVNPRDPEGGLRRFKIGREVWIERTDYEDVQPKGFFRLFPGNKVRLKYGHTIVCTGATRDAGGKLVEVLATLVPDTKSGTPGADAVKVKGNITWVAVADAVPVEVRLYERLFATPQPGSGEMLDELNRESLVTCAAFAEPSLAVAKFGGAAFQFERHGYFVVDAKAADDGTLVFNRAAGMRDSREK